MLGRILNVVDSVNDRLGKAFSPLIIIMMLMVVYDVVMRYFFSRPTLWGMELVCILLAGVVFIGAGYSFLHGTHVQVEIFYNQWSPRVKATVDVFTSFFLIITCAVLIKYGGEEAYASLVEGRRSVSAWGPPLWISQILVPIGALLIGFQALAKWIRDLVIAITGVDKLATKLETGKGGIFDKEKEE